MEQQGTWKDIMGALEDTLDIARKNSRQGADAQQVYDTFEPKDIMTLLLEKAGTSIEGGGLRGVVDATNEAKIPLAGNSYVGKHAGKNTAGGDYLELPAAAGIIASTIDVFTELMNEYQNQLDNELEGVQDQAEIDYRTDKKDNAGGFVRDIDKLKKIADHINTMQNGIADGNEVLFRRGLNDFSGAVGYDNDMDEAILAFYEKNEDGITLNEDAIMNAAVEAYLIKIRKYLSDDYQIDEQHRNSAWDNYQSHSNERIEELSGYRTGRLKWEEDKEALLERSAELDARRSEEEAQEMSLMDRYIQNEIRTTEENELMLELTDHMATEAPREHEEAFETLAAAKSWYDYLNGETSKSRHNYDMISNIIAAYRVTDHGMEELEAQVREEAFGKENSASTTPSEESESPVPTATPAPTATPEATPGPTATVTPAPSPTASPAASTAPTATSTPTATAEATSTPTATATSAPSPTASPATAPQPAASPAPTVPPVIAAPPKAKESPAPAETPAPEASVPTPPNERVPSSFLLETKEELMAILNRPDVKARFLEEDEVDLENLVVLRPEESDLLEAEEFQSGMDGLQEELEDGHAALLERLGSIERQLYAMAAQIAQAKGEILRRIGKAEDGGQANAEGTNNFTGGMTKINERGDELIELPEGTKIYPAHETGRRMQSASPVNVDMDVHIAQLVVREDADLDRIARQLYEKLCFYQKIMP